MVGFHIVGTSMAHTPLTVRNFTFIDFDHALSVFLTINNREWCFPLVVSPTILSIKSVPIKIGLSNHMYPPCMQYKRILMQTLTLLLRPKCGMSNRLRRPTCSNPLDQTLATGMLCCVSGSTLNSSYLWGTILGNFAMSVMSWSTYFS
jgi:hypothetical protein